MRAKPDEALSLLVVDDNPDNLYVIRLLLETAMPDVEVLVTTDPRQALETAEQRKPDGIISDLKMPAMDGTQLCGALKSSEKTKHIPVILITSQDTSSELRARALEAGADDFIRRPIDNSELAARIRVMLRIKSAEDKLRNMNRNLEAMVAEKTKKIEASLLEKETLLKELHHRVKNNMAVISSMLSLQSNTFEDPRVVEAFKECNLRIRTMSLVHERLYKAGEFAHIDFAAYIPKLLNDIFHSYKSDGKDIHLDIRAGKLFLSIENAIPCGMILNELVTNALKYAFPHRRDGTIAVRCNGGDGFFTLSVRDNGKGLPEDFDFEKADSFGIYLVRILTAQLEGELDINGKDGTGFNFKFPLKQPVNKSE